MQKNLHTHTDMSTNDEWLEDRKYSSMKDEISQNFIQQIPSIYGDFTFHAKRRQWVVEVVYDLKFYPFMMLLCNYILGLITK